MVFFSSDFYIEEVLKETLLIDNGVGLKKLWVN